MRYGQHRSCSALIANFSLISFVACATGWLFILIRKLSLRVEVMSVMVLLLFIIFLFSYIGNFENGRFKVGFNCRSVEMIV